MVLVLQCSLLPPPSPNVSTSRGMPGKIMMNCCLEQSISGSKQLSRHVLSGCAATLVFISQLNQIYSRTPNPGPEFIEKYKSYLANFGYNPSKITDTPQDCEQMTDTRLSAMMSMPGMQQAFTNEFPDLELKKSVQFDALTSVFDTLKKLVQLYFK